MNPWKDALGCEVTVCQAKHCDQDRMKDCYLRKCYLERLSFLERKLRKLQGTPLAAGVHKELKNLKGDDE